MKLVIANKTYSSWSMRPWILMRHLGIAFEEIVVPLRRETTREEILRFSPAGKCPVLLDGALTIWESLAIIEHLAERVPDRAIWPRDPAARALARSLAAEMHGGFQGLRAHLPMNLRRPVGPRALTPAAAADVERLERAFADARARFGGGTGFLFGAFGAVDAMFAPVVSRLHTYDVPVGAPTRRYMDACMELPAWRAWAADAVREPWRIAAFDAI